MTNLLALPLIVVSFLAWRGPHKTRLDRALACWLALLAGLLLGSPTHADEVKRLDWDPPTHCEDGAAIGTDTCTPLEEYRLQCSTDGAGEPYDDFEWRIPAPATSDARSYAPGDYWCRISVSNSAGFSGWSEEEVFFSVPLPLSVPNPPTTVTVSDGGL